SSRGSSAEIWQQLSLQQLLSIVQSGTDRSDRALHDLRDFLMAQAVNFKKGHHRSVFNRQFLHRFVQFFLELADVSFSMCAGFVSQGRQDFPRDRIVLVDLLQAEKGPQAVFPEIAEGRVDRDPVDPGEKRSLALKAMD